jgi:hypothetical protein
MDLDGWIEIGGRRLSSSAIKEILARHPEEVTQFGGEFRLAWKAAPPGTLSASSRERPSREGCLPGRDHQADSPFFGPGA